MEKLIKDITTIDVNFTDGTERTLEEFNNLINHTFNTYRDVYSATSFKLGSRREDASYNSYYGNEDGHDYLTMILYREETEEEAEIRIKAYKAYVEKEKAAEAKRKQVAEEKKKQRELLAQKKKEEQEKLEADPEYKELVRLQKKFKV